MSEAERTNPLPIVAYYRVSTQRQGLSGLGLEAQRAAVLEHVGKTGEALVSEFTEVESGKVASRPQLALALASCRATGAVLVIAKLDRLARNVAFLSALMDDGQVEFRALDLPGASRFVLHVLAAVAEQEALAISQRTKAALAAARARGIVLGHPANLTAASRRAALASRRAAIAKRNGLVIPLIRAWRKNRHTTRWMAEELTRLQVALPAGGSKWHPAQVRRVVALAKLSRARKAVA